MENTLVYIFKILDWITTLLDFFGIKITLPHTRRWHKEYIDNNITNEFSNYLPSDSSSNTNNNIETSKEEDINGNIYIQPYITTIPPKDGVQTALQIKNPILLKDFFLKQVFVKRSKLPKVYLLLGNTGSGKTSALVHLLSDYINNHTQSNLPYNIQIFSLRPDNFFETINNAPLEYNKKNILLLDALDENLSAQKPKASKEYTNFLHKLEEIYKNPNFAFIIITCRSQFFKDISEEPSKTNIPIGGSDPWLKVNKLLLEPFNDKQVQDFLDQTFSISNEAEKHSKAAALIKKHNSIASRPIILAYIRDIVESNREINTSLDFYDTIVDKELHRNISRIQPTVTNRQVKQWWDMTSEVAGYMYEHGKTEILYDELLHILIDHQLAKPNDTTINEDLFQQRSLLTRTGDIFHFSHKSFYEYFMAYRFLQHPEEIKQVYGMDFALQIYDDALQAWSEPKDTPFAELKNTHPYTVASSLHCLGSALDDINHFGQAKPYYKVALDIFNKLEEGNPNTYKDDITLVLNDLAILHNNTNQLDNAEKEYNEALKTYRQLADKNPDAYLPDVAMTLNNLAVLHRETNQLDKAEEEYNEALNIRRQLADENPDAYQPYVATTLNNLALLHSNTNQYKEAEEEFNEALNIRRQLANKKPDAYLPRVADTLNNLANLHSNTNQYKEAEEEYNEASSTYQQLADKSPDAYLADVAMTLNNLAILHSDTNQLDKAEKEYNEALTTYRQLAAQNPDAYLPDVAMTLNNLAVLHKDTNQYKEAEEEFDEALSIRRQLADKNPDAFLPYVAGTLFNLSLMHLTKEERDLPAAEAVAQESMEIYRIMAEKSPAAFEQKVEMGEKLLEEIRQKIKSNK